MRIGSIVKYLLGVTVILVLADPSEAGLIHFLFGPIIDKFFKTGHDVLKAVGHVAVGGGTAVVYDAIKLNYFDIGPTLKKFFFHALFELLEKGVGLVGSVGWLVISSIIWKIFEIIKWIVKGIWYLKYELVKKAVTVVVPVVAAGEVNLDIDINAAEVRSMRSADPFFTVLRGRRDIRRLDYGNLESTFTSATLGDRMECLPMVFCAIYADPEDLVSPVESRFKKAFRSFFNESYTPVWAAKYVKATVVGESSKSNDKCQAEYPNCTFSPRHLRRLITQAVNAYLYRVNHKKVES